VDQIALPYRIALVAILVLGGLWFVALRPKSGGSTASTPAPAVAAPGVKGLASDVAKAKGAVAQSQASAAAVTAKPATPTGKPVTPTAKPATPTAKPATPTAKPATPASKPVAPAAPVAKTTAADPSAPILAAVAKGKVAVLLFSSRQASDDAHVRAVLHRIDRHGGKVVVRSAPIGDVGRYDAITRGVQVLQAPTLLVIDPQRKAKAIVGYTDTAEVDQAVDDALRAAA
jgi:hypothetical protein